MTYVDLPAGFLTMGVNVYLYIKVPKGFVPSLARLADIEELAGITFDAALREADQYATQRGEEIAKRANVKKRKNPAKG